MASLFKRGRVWWVSYYDKDRKRIRKRLDTDKREAERKMLDVIREENNDDAGGVFLGPSWETFKEKYLAHSKGTKAAATHYQDRMAIRSLEQYQKPDKLIQLTPEILERWKAHRKAEGKSVQTINRELGAIKALLRKAHEWGYLKSQPWYGVKKLKHTRPKLLFYSADELRGLIQVCEGAYRTLVLLGSRAGLRRAEAYHLTWDDVDFERQRLHVCPKADWQPKGYKQRWIPMPDDLTAHLERLKMRHKGPYVMEDRPSTMAVSLRFRRLIRAAGLTGSLHTLRHTYASHMVQAGVPLYTVSKLLGHSSIAVTMIYAHLAPESMAEAVKKLPSL